MDWQEISGNWVLLPDRPTAIIHFLGGAFVATAPQVTYRRLLERLAMEGYAIVATPFVNTFDHKAIAQTTLRNFNRALEKLYETSLRKRYLPIYGVGHSMGCKLHLLIGSLFPTERAGNVLISFNNFSARDAVPLMEQFSSVFLQISPDFSMEFTPSPQETNQLVAQNYQVRRNLLVKFKNDTLDQTTPLEKILHGRFPGMIVSQALSGNHLTPLGGDVTWKVGNAFTPFDAIAQWMRQEVYRELHQLERAILQWLNPLKSL
jgi:esterase/lipase